MPSSTSTNKSEIRRVFKTYETYKTWRQSTWEPVWTECDRFYNGFKEVKNWPGTKTPRSAIAIKSLAELIDTLHPTFVFSLFHSPGERFFDFLSTAPTPSVRKLEERIHFILTTPDRIGRTSLWALKQALRSFLRYTTCYTDVGFHAGLGRAVVQDLNVRDVYLAPTTGPWVDSTSSWIRRGRVRVARLLELRNQPGYTIPSKKDLVKAAKASTRDTNDQESTLVLSENNDTLSPEDDDLLVDVLVYQSREQVIWVAGHDAETGFRLYSGENPYKLLTISQASYYPFLDKTGGQNLLTRLGGEQHLQQRIINMSLDLLDLQTLPPVRTGTASQEVAFGPNIAVPSRDATQGVPFDVRPLGAEAFQHYSESRSRATRGSGVSDLQVSGLATPSNQNRTGIGVRAGQESTQIRQFGPLSEFEEKMLVPVLTKVNQIDLLFGRKTGQVETRSFDTSSRSDGGEQLQTGNQQAPQQDQRSQPQPTGSSVELVEAASLPADGFFEVRTASRMISRQSLAGALDTALRYNLNPQTIELARQQGKTLDFEEINEFVNDAMGTSKKYQFYRDMTPQEAQGIKTAQEQKQLADNELRKELAGVKSRTEEQKLKAGLEMSRDKDATEILKILTGRARG